MSLSMQQYAMVPPATNRAALCRASISRPHIGFKRNLAEQEADTYSVSGCMGTQCCKKSSLAGNICNIKA